MPAGPVTMLWAGCGHELNAAHVAWITARIGQGRGWDYGKCPTLGVYKNRTLQAVLLFHDWNPDAGVICMSAAFDDPSCMTRRVIRAAHGYPFDELRCQQVVLQVSSRNRRMLRIAERLGYELHLMPRMRGRDEDEYWCLLADNTWQASKFSR